MKFKAAFESEYGEKITNTYGTENAVSIDSDDDDCPVCNETTATERRDRMVSRTTYIPSIDSVFAQYL